MKFKPLLATESELVVVRYDLPFGLAAEPKGRVVVVTKDGPGGEKVGDILRFTTKWNDREPGMFDVCKCMEVCAPAESRTSPHRSARCATALTVAPEPRCLPLAMCAAPAPELFRSGGGRAGLERRHLRRGHCARVRALSRVMRAQMGIQWREQAEGRFDCNARWYVTRSHVGTRT